MYVKLELIGRLVKTPELRYTNSGTEVCNFTVAADAGYGKSKNTQYIDCVAWQGAAKYIAKYIHKGYLVFVEGEMTVKTNKTKNGTYKNPVLTVRNFKPLSDPDATKKDYKPRVNDIDEKESDDTEYKEESKTNNDVDIDDFDDNIPF